MNDRSRKMRYMLINLLTAVAISLVVNFSSLVYNFTYKKGNITLQDSIIKLNSPPVARTITLLRDSKSFTKQDKIEIQKRTMGRFYWKFIVIEIFFYTLLAFIMLMISTARLKLKNSSLDFGLRVLICFAVSVLFVLIYPKITDLFNAQILTHSRQIVDPMLLLKTLLTLVVVLLYGKIFDLIYQKQTIVYENEVLKNENLQATYNSLVSQINPHFFFNSLNSLSMLVRGRHNDKALDYIDRLSDSFRYIIQKGQKEMTTLSEELKFLEAYTYMLDIRYEGKIFFEIEIEPQYELWRIPTLSLQPLIENAVKHNTITQSSPLTMTIRTQNDTVIVSNPVKPRMENYAGTGIGLKNLAARYKLLTNNDISVYREGGVFEVTLPLISPKS